MKNLFLTVITVFFAMSCARVQVQAPKDPIKVDISMRLDVYQHVEKDIDAIEDLVSGSAVEPQSKIDSRLFRIFVSEAHAEEGLSPEIEQAALRRRDRLADLHAWLSKGVLGENQSGLIEIRKSGEADAALQGLVEAENKDRMIIYRGIAEKNGTSVGDVQKIYAQRLQSDAPAGTPVQGTDGAWSNK